MTQENQIDKKNYGRFNLAILKVKIDPLWKNWCTIRLKPLTSNLLPQPCDSSKSTDYFFPWSTATTSSPTCDFKTPLKAFWSSWKLFMQQLKQSSSSWCESWSW